MNPIPQRIKKVLGDDRFMARCIACNTFGTQWHHPFTHNKKQINEVWSIVGLCPECHEKEFEKKQLSIYVSLVRARALYGDLEPLYEKYKLANWDRELLKSAEVVKQHKEIRIIRLVEFATRSIIMLKNKYPEIINW